VPARPRIEKPRKIKAEILAKQASLDIADWRNNNAIENTGERNYFVPALEKNYPTLLRLRQLHSGTSEKSSF
jgi:hypothetical protein